jgi:hypothetical protein
MLGGIFSLAIMVLLITAFSNRIIDTFNKVIIMSSLSTSNANDPLPFTLNTTGKGPFMFAVEVLNFDLNGEERYFDVDLTTSVSRYGKTLN